MILNRIVSRIYRGAIYFPKTVYINFKCLPIRQAIKLPIVIISRSNLKGLQKGNVIINGNVEFGMINIGSQNTAKRGILTGKTSHLILEEGGRIVFNGKASIGLGSSVCAAGGTISFGDLFSCNVNCFIYSNSRISFGRDVLLGWNINIRDNDGHPLLDVDGKQINPSKPIQIGDRVWIASYSDVLKGVTMANGTIVATHSLVTKSVEENNTVIAGMPAKIVKRQVFWAHR